MICRSDSITLLSPPGAVHVWSEQRKIFKKLSIAYAQKQRVSARRLSMELDISHTNVRRIMKNALELCSYKIVIEPLLSDNQKTKWEKIANWVRTNFRKEKAMRILFSNEKFFDIDGIYNSQNDRMWAVDRADTNKKRWH